MKSKEISKKFLLALAMSGLLVVGGNAISNHAVSANANSVRTARRVRTPASNYYQKAPKIVYTRRYTDIYKKPNKTHRSYTANPGLYYPIKSLNKADRSLETRGGNYITANKNYVRATNGYQNPKRYYQVSYAPIKASKTIPSAGAGWEGMRVYRACRRLGIYSGHNYLTNYDTYVIRNFQRRHHLDVTGRLNYSTWRKLGFSKVSWYNDSSMKGNRFSPTDNRWVHINKGINYIKKYLGGTWISGTSSSPYFKDADCSGLVMQYLAAGGLKSKYTPMYHASPGNEWDSQKMWADPKLKWVPFSQRQRGDLVFFRDPSTYNIWHVGIILGHSANTGYGNNLILDSWPPYIEYHSIYNSEHGIIAGIKRPFD